MLPLLGWVFGLGAFAAVMGSLISTMIHWLEQDKCCQKIDDRHGSRSGDDHPGFLAMIGVMFGVAVAQQVLSSRGRGNEESVVSKPSTTGQVLSLERSQASGGRRVNVNSRP